MSFIVLQGMGQEDDKTRLPDGRPAEFATKRLDDQEEEHDDEDEDLDEPVVSSDVRGATVPYEWPYETLTLRKILGTTGLVLSLPTCARRCLQVYAPFSGRGGRPKNVESSQ